MKTKQQAAFNYFKSAGNSKVQEKFSEYLFLKDLIIEAANKGIKIAISRTDFDSFGFDVLLECEVAGKAKSRKVQLKARSGGKDRDGWWSVHKALLQSKDGRVILIRLSMENDAIHAKYKMFDGKHTSVALNRKPRNPHPARCVVKENEFIDISRNLLKVFK